MIKLKTVSMESAVSKIEQELNQWREAEDEGLKAVPGSTQGREFFRDRLRQYEKIIAIHSGNAIGKDRVVLNTLIREKNKLEKQLYKDNFLGRMVHRVVAFFTNKKEAKISVAKSVANENSVKAAIVDSGFGTVNLDVASQMRKGLSGFSVPVSYQVTKDVTMDFDLYVKKGATGEYEVQGYRAKYQDSTNGIQRTAYFKATDAISATQAFNLLAGRSVATDYIDNTGNKQTVWRQLDLNNSDGQGNLKMRNFYPGYGFNPAEQLKKVYLNQGNNSLHFNDLLTGLREGNIMKAVVGKQDPDVYFLQASPQYKTLDVMDKGGNKVKFEELVKRDQKVETKVKQMLSDDTFNLAVEAVKPANGIKH